MLYSNILTSLLLYKFSVFSFLFFQKYDGYHKDRHITSDYEDAQWGGYEMERVKSLSFVNYVGLHIVGQLFM